MTLRSAFASRSDLSHALVSPCSRCPHLGRYSTDGLSRVHDRAGSCTAGYLFPPQHDDGPPIARSSLSGGPAPPLGQWQPPPQQQQHDAPHDAPSATSCPLNFIFAAAGAHGHDTSPLQPGVDEASPHDRPSWRARSSQGLVSPSALHGWQPGFSASPQAGTFVPEAAATAMRAHATAAAAAIHPFLDSVASDVSSGRGTPRAGAATTASGSDVGRTGGLGESTGTPDASDSGAAVVGAPRQLRRSELNMLSMSGMVVGPQQQQHAAAAAAAAASVLSRGAAGPLLSAAQRAQRAAPPAGSSSGGGGGAAAAPEVEQQQPPPPEAEPAPRDAAEAQDSGPLHVVGDRPGPHRTATFSFDGVLDQPRVSPTMLSAMQEAGPASPKPPPPTLLLPPPPSYSPPPDPQHLRRRQQRRSSSSAASTPTASTPAAAAAGPQGPPASPPLRGPGAPPTLLRSSLPPAGVGGVGGIPADLAPGVLRGRRSSFYNHVAKAASRAASGADGGGNGGGSEPPSGLGGAGDSAGDARWSAGRPSHSAAAAGSSAASGGGGALGHASLDERPSLDYHHSTRHSASSGLQGEGSSLYASTGRAGLRRAGAAAATDAVPERHDEEEEEEGAMEDPDLLPPPTTFDIMAAAFGWNTPVGSGTSMTEAPWQVVGGEDAGTAAAAAAGDGAGDAGAGVEGRVDSINSNSGGSQRASVPAFGHVASELSYDADMAEGLREALALDDDELMRMHSMGEVGRMIARTWRTSAPFAATAGGFAGAAASSMRVPAAAAAAAAGGRAMQFGGTSPLRSESGGGGAPALLPPGRRSTSGGAAPTPRLVADTPPRSNTHQMEGVGGEASSQTAPLPPQRAAVHIPRVTRHASTEMPPAAARSGAAPAPLSDSQVPHVATADVIMPRASLEPSGGGRPAEARGHGAPSFSKHRPVGKRGVSFKAQLEEDLEETAAKAVTLRRSLAGDTATLLAAAQGVGSAPGLLHRSSGSWSVGAERRPSVRRQQSSEALGRRASILRQRSSDALGQLSRAARQAAGVEQARESAPGVAASFQVRRARIAAPCAHFQSSSCARDASLMMRKASRVHAGRELQRRHRDGLRRHHGHHRGPRHPLGGAAWPSLALRQRQHRAAARAGAPRALCAAALQQPAPLHGQLARHAQPALPPRCL